MQDNYTFAQPGIQRMVFKLKELVARIDSKLHVRRTRFAIPRATPPNTLHTSVHSLVTAVCSAAQPCAQPHIRVHSRVDTRARALIRRT